MIDLIFLPLLAGIIIALTMGPVGCFVVWRRMAYFGDTLAHGALIGVALSFLFYMPIIVGTLLICVLLSLILLVLQKKSAIPTDSLLGILSHTVLAGGIVIISSLETSVNIMGFLFGDILAVQKNEVITIFLIGATALILLYQYWDSLVLMSLNPELAQAEGIKTDKLNIILIMIMAFVSAIGIKIVGALLTTALLVIPASTARYASNSPKQMAGFSALFAVMSVLMGVTGSFFMDLPVGPMIVLSAAALFLFFSVFIRKIAG